MPEAKQEKTIEQLLFEDRIIFVRGEISDELSATVNMGLLYLEQKDPEADIFMFFDSPGGSVHGGFSTFDTMNFVSCDIWTVCQGMAASMAAFLLACGTPGKRICFPNSSVMIHQPLLNMGNSYRQATEVHIVAREIMRTRQRMNCILAERTGKSLEQIELDTERDNYMYAEEAKEYGLVDEVIGSRGQLKEFIHAMRKGGSK